MLVLLLWALSPAGSATFPTAPLCSFHLGSAGLAPSTSPFPASSFPAGTVVSALWLSMFSLLSVSAAKVRGCAPERMGKGETVGQQRHGVCKGWCWQLPRTRQNGQILNWSPSFSCWNHTPRSDVGGIEKQPGNTHTVLNSTPPCKQDDGTEMIPLEELAKSRAETLTLERTSKHLHMLLIFACTGSLACPYIFCWHNFIFHFCNKSYRTKFFMSP